MENEIAERVAALEFVAGMVMGHLIATDPRFEALAGQMLDDAARTEGAEENVVWLPSTGTLRSFDGHMRHMLNHAMEVADEVRQGE